MAISAFLLLLCLKFNRCGPFVRQPAAAEGDARGRNAAPVARAADGGRVPPGALPDAVGGLRRRAATERLDAPAADDVAPAAVRP